MKFSDCNTETLVELTEYLLSLIESGKTSTAFTNLYMGLTKDRFDAYHKNICFTYNYRECRIGLTSSNNFYSRTYTLSVAGSEKVITDEIHTLLYKRIAAAYDKTETIGEDFQAILTSAIRADTITDILEHI